MENCMEEIHMKTCMEKVDSSVLSNFAASSEVRHEKHGI